MGTISCAVTGSRLAHNLHSCNPDRWVKAAGVGHFTGSTVSVTFALTFTLDNKLPLTSAAFSEPLSGLKTLKNC